MKHKIKQWLRQWLGITGLASHVEMLDDMLLHREARLNGFAVLKKHLNRPDKPLPQYKGKDIEQD